MDYIFCLRERRCLGLSTDLLARLRKSHSRERWRQGLSVHFAPCALQVIILPCLGVRRLKSGSNNSLFTITQCKCQFGSGRGKLGSKGALETESCKCRKWKCVCSCGGDERVGFVYEFNIWEEKLNSYDKNTNDDPLGKCTLQMWERNQYWNCTPVTSI